MGREYRISNVHALTIWHCTAVSHTLQPHSMDGRCPWSWLLLLQLEWHDTCTEPKFRLSVKKTNPSKLACVTVQLLTDKVRCACQMVMFVLCWINYVLWSCDAYWTPTTLSCFLLTFPAMRHHVPSHIQSDGWHLLDVQSSRLFPLHFPSHASPCAISYK